MQWVLLIGIIVGVADVTGAIDVPNWVNWLLIGGPLVFMIGFLVLLGIAAKKYPDL